MLEIKSIYVVDDEESVLQSVKAVLTHFGYAPKCFHSADQFLGALGPDAPGCLVTDLHMPGIDGVQLQERLSAIESSLSIVFLTGVADVATAVKVMRNGAATLLEKPYSNRDLLLSVQHGLEASQKRWHAKQLAQNVRVKLDSLSADEKSVMKLMLSGTPNKTVASTLDIGMRTVDRRRQSILTKMGVVSFAELATMVSASAPEFMESS